MPRPTETANLYELESFDELDEILKNNEKVIVYFHAPFHIDSKITKPIIRTLAYKYRDIPFFLVNIGRHKDIADVYGKGTRPKVTLFQYGRSMAEISGPFPYARCGPDPYEIFDKKITTIFRLNDFTPSE